MFWKNTYFTGNKMLVAITAFADAAVNAATAVTTATALCVFMSRCVEYKQMKKTKKILQICVV